MSASYPPPPPPATGPTSAPPPATEPTSAAPGAQAGTDGPAGTDGLHWRRFHPVTPVIKGWKMLAVLLVLLGQQTVDNIAAAQDVASHVGPLIVAVVLAAFLLLTTGYSAIAWRMTRYAVGPDAVYLRTGVVFRQARTARLDRIQAIDVVQPLLARIIGLAELKIEVAGGADSALRMSFLREQAAHGLRAELLARAAGVALPAGGFPGGATAGDPLAPGVGHVPALGAGPGALPGHPADAGPGTFPGHVPGHAVPEAPEREVFAVSAGTLIGSLVRSAAVLLSAVFLLAAVVAVAITRDPGAFAGMLPALLGAGGFVWQRFAGEFDFRGAISPDGIRLRHGMLERRAQTVPPGRVQAVSLVQGPLWRGKDWWRVQMNVAGYGLGSNQNRQTESVLMPVGTRADARLALWLVLPDLGVADPIALLDAALTGKGPDGGFVTSPRGPGCSTRGPGGATASRSPSTPS